MNPKALHRRRAKAQRASLPAQVRRAHAQTIADHVMASRLWQEAETVGCYISMATEVDTQAYLASGKRVAIPRVRAAGQALEFFDAASAPLVRSSFGVLEPGPEATPIPMAQLDLMLIPGLAADLQGGRLGFGGGFYDRTLAGTAVPRLMVVFGELVWPQVPVDEHDERMHALVTERGIVTCPGCPFVL